MRSRRSRLNFFHGRKLKKKNIRYAIWSTAILASFFTVILASFHILMNRNVLRRSEEALKSLAREYTANNMEAEAPGLMPGEETWTEAWTGTEAEDEDGSWAGTEAEDEDGSWAGTEAEDENGSWAGTETGEETETETELLFEEDESSLYAVSFLVNEDYRTEFFVSANEKQLADWCRANPWPDNKIHEAKVDGRTYYVLSMEDRYFSDQNQYRWIMYVDITAQKYLISQVERAEILIMIICAIVAMYLGILFGISFQEEQERQKQFFENASHELKTPLMSIQGYAEGIESGVVPDTKQASRIILSETDKMRVLIEEILSLSRLESRQMKFHPEKVEISEVVNNCLMSLEYVIRSRGLTVSLDLDDTKLEADPDQFERVVINLISNAVKYADSKITISCGKGRLNIGNDGSRLSQEELDHIFDRFYIGERGSTGIGLALVKEIVEKHGWKIFCGNVPGGVCFTILFGRRLH